MLHRITRCLFVLVAACLVHAGASGAGVCSHGTLRSAGENFFCQCFPGWTGLRCNYRRVDAAPSPYHHVALRHPVYHHYYQYHPRHAPVQHHYHHTIHHYYPPPPPPPIVQSLPPVIYSPTPVCRVKQSYILLKYSSPVLFPFFYSQRLDYTHQSWMVLRKSDKKPYKRHTTCMDNRSIREYVLLRIRHHPCLYYARTFVQPPKCHLKFGVSREAEGGVQTLYTKEQVSAANLRYLLFLHSQGSVRYLVASASQQQYFRFTSTRHFRSSYQKIGAAARTFYQDTGLIYRRIALPDLPVGIWGFQEENTMETFSVVTDRANEFYFKEENADPGAVRDRTALLYEKVDNGLAAQDVSATSGFKVSWGIMMTERFMKIGQSSLVTLCSDVEERVVWFPLYVENPTTMSVILPNHRHDLISFTEENMFLEAVQQRTLHLFHQNIFALFNRECSGGLSKLVPPGYFRETRSSQRFLDHDPNCETIYTSYEIDHHPAIYQGYKVSVSDPLPLFLDMTRVSRMGAKATSLLLEQIVPVVQPSSTQEEEITYDTFSRVLEPLTLALLRDGSVLPTASRRSVFVSETRPAKATGLTLTILAMILSVPDMSFSERPHPHGCTWQVIHRGDCDSPTVFLMEGKLEHPTTSSTSELMITLQLLHTSVPSYHSVESRTDAGQQHAHPHRYAMYTWHCPGSPPRMVPHSYFIRTRLSTAHTHKNQCETLYTGAVIANNLYPTQDFKLQVLIFSSHYLAVQVSTSSVMQTTPMILAESPRPITNTGVFTFNRSKCILFGSKTKIIEISFKEEVHEAMINVWKRDSLAQRRRKRTQSKEQGLREIQRRARANLEDDYELKACLEDDSDCFRRLNSKKRYRKVYKSDSEMVYGPRRLEEMRKEPKFAVIIPGPPTTLPTMDAPLEVGSHNPLLATWHVSTQSLDYYRTSVIVSRLHSPTRGIVEMGGLVQGRITSYQTMPHSHGHIVDITRQDEVNLLKYQEMNPAVPHKYALFSRECSGWRMKMVPSLYFQETRHSIKYLDHSRYCETLYTATPLARSHHAYQNFMVGVTTFSDNTKIYESSSVSLVPSRVSLETREVAQLQTVARPELEITMASITEIGSQWLKLFMFDHMVDYNSPDKLIWIMDRSKLNLGRTTIALPRLNMFHSMVQALTRGWSRRFTSVRNRPSSTEFVNSLYMPIQPYEHPLTMTYRFTPPSYLISSTVRDSDLVENVFNAAMLFFHMDRYAMFQKHCSMLFSRIVSKNYFFPRNRKTSRDADSTTTGCETLYSSSKLNNNVIPAQRSKTDVIKTFGLFHSFQISTTPLLHSSLMILSEPIPFIETTFAEITSRTACRLFGTESRIVEVSYFDQGQGTHVVQSNDDLQPVNEVMIEVMKRRSAPQSEEDARKEMDRRGRANLEDRRPRIVRRKRDWENEVAAEEHLRMFLGQLAKKKAKKKTIKNRETEKVKVVKNKGMTATIIPSPSHQLPIMIAHPFGEAGLYSTTDFTSTQLIIHEKRSVTIHQLGINSCATILAPCATDDLQPITGTSPAHRTTHISQSVSSSSTNLRSYFQRDLVPTASEERVLLYAKQAMHYTALRGFSIPGPGRFHPFTRVEQLPRITTGVSIVFYDSFYMESQCFVSVVELSIDDHRIGFSFAHKVVTVGKSSFKHPNTALGMIEKHRPHPTDKTFREIKPEKLIGFPLHLKHDISIHYHSQFYLLQTPSFIHFDAVVVVHRATVCTKVYIRQQILRNPRPASYPFVRQLFPRQFGRIKVSMPAVLTGKKWVQMGFETTSSFVRNLSYCSRKITQMIPARKDRRSSRCKKSGKGMKKSTQPQSSASKRSNKENDEECHESDTTAKDHPITESHPCNIFIWSLPIAQLQLYPNMASSEAVRQRYHKAFVLLESHSDSPTASRFQRKTLPVLKTMYLVAQRPRFKYSAEFNPQQSSITRRGTLQRYMYLKRALKLRKYIHKMTVEIVTSLEQSQMDIKPFSFQVINQYGKSSNMFAYSKHIAQGNVLVHPKVPPVAHHSKSYILDSHTMKTHSNRLVVRASVVAANEGRRLTPSKKTTLHEEHRHVNLTTEGGVASHFSVQTTSADDLLLTKRKLSSKEIEFYYGFGFNQDCSKSEYVGDLDCKKISSRKHVNQKTSRNTNKTAKLGSSNQKTSQDAKKTLKSGKSKAEYSCSRKSSDQASTSNSLSSQSCNMCKLRISPDGHTFRLPRAKICNYCPGKSSTARLLKRDTTCLEKCIHGLVGPYYWAMPFTNYFTVWGYDMSLRTSDFTVFYSFYNTNYHQYTYPDTTIQLNSGALYPSKDSLSYSNLDANNSRYPVTFCLSSFYYNVRLELDITLAVTVTGTATSSYSWTSFCSHKSVLSNFSFGTLGMYLEKYDRKKSKYVLQRLPVLRLSSFPSAQYKYSTSSRYYLSRAWRFRYGVKMGKGRAVSSASFKQVLRDTCKLVFSSQARHVFRMFGATVSSDYSFGRDTMTLLRGTKSVSRLIRSNPTILAISVFAGTSLTVPTTYDTDYYHPGSKASTESILILLTLAKGSVLQKENHIVLTWRKVIAAHNLRHLSGRVIGRVNYAGYKRRLNSYHRIFLRTAVVVGYTPTLSRSKSKQERLLTALYSIDSLRRVFGVAGRAVLLKNYVQQGSVVRPVQFVALLTKYSSTARHTFVYLASLTEFEEKLGTVKSSNDKTLSKAVFLIERKGVKIRVLEFVLQYMNVHQYSRDKIRADKRFMWVSASKYSYTKAEGRALQVDLRQFKTDFKVTKRHTIMFIKSHTLKSIAYSFWRDRGLHLLRNTTAAQTKGKKSRLLTKAKAITAVFAITEGKDVLKLLIGQKEKVVKLHNIQQVTEISLKEVTWVMVVTHVAHQSKHTVEQFYRKHYVVQKQWKFHNSAAGYSTRFTKYISSILTVISALHSRGLSDMSAVQQGAVDGVLSARFLNSQLWLKSTRTNHHLALVEIITLHSFHKTVNRHTVKLFSSTRVQETATRHYRSLTVFRRRYVSSSKTFGKLFSVIKSTRPTKRVFSILEGYHGYKRYNGYAFVVMRYFVILSDTDHVIRHVVWDQVISQHKIQEGHVLKYARDIKDNTVSVASIKGATVRVTHSTYKNKKNQVYLIKKHSNSRRNILFMTEVVILHKAKKRFLSSHTLKTIFTATSGNAREVRMIHIRLTVSTMKKHLLRYTSTKMVGVTTVNTMGLRWHSRRLQLSASTTKAVRRALTTNAVQAVGPSKHSTSEPGIKVHARYYFTVARIHQYLPGVGNARSITQIAVKTSTVISKEHRFSQSLLIKSNHRLDALQKRIVTLPELSQGTVKPMFHSVVKKKIAISKVPLVMAPRIQNTNGAVLKKYITSQAFKRDIDSSKGQKITVSVVTLVSNTKYETAKKLALFHMRSGIVKPPVTATLSREPKTYRLLRISFKTQRKTRKPVTRSAKSLNIPKFGLSTVGGKRVTPRFTHTIERIQKYGPTEAKGVIPNVVFLRTGEVTTESHKLSEFVSLTKNVVIMGVSRKPKVLKKMSNAKLVAVVRFGARHKDSRSKSPLIFSLILNKSGGSILKKYITSFSLGNHIDSVSDVVKPIGMRRFVQTHKMSSSPKLKLLQSRPLLQKPSAGLGTYRVPKSHPNLQVSFKMEHKIRPPVGSTASQAKPPAKRFFVDTKRKPMYRFSYSVIVAVMWITRNTFVKLIAGKVPVMSPDHEALPAMTMRILGRMQSTTNIVIISRGSRSGPRAVSLARTHYVFVLNTKQTSMVNGNPQKGGLDFNQMIDSAPPKQSKYVSSYVSSHLSWPLFTCRVQYLRNKKKATFTGVLLSKAMKKQCKQLYLEHRNHSGGGSADGSFMSPARGKLIQGVSHMLIQSSAYFGGHSAIFITTCSNTDFFADSSIRSANVIKEGPMQKTSHVETHHWLAITKVRDSTPQLWGYDQDSMEVYLNTISIIYPDVASKRLFTVEERERSTDVFVDVRSYAYNIHAMMYVSGTKGD